MSYIEDGIYSRIYMNEEEKRIEEEEELTRRPRIINLTGKEVYHTMDINIDTKPFYEMMNKIVEAIGDEREELVDKFIKTALKVRNTYGLEHLYVVVDYDISKNIDLMDILNEKMKDTKVNNKIMLGREYYYQPIIHLYQLKSYAFERYEPCYYYASENYKK